MEYLIKTQNFYRVENEQEALALRDRLNGLTNCELTTFSYSIKSIKEKGEIVEQYYLCKAILEFNAEKDPERRINIDYQG